VRREIAQGPVLCSFASEPPRVAMELFESEANCFLHQFGPASVASSSDPRIHIPNEASRETDGYRGTSTSHSRWDLLNLRFKIFQAPTTGISHKVDDARVAMFTRNSFNLGVQVRWDRRCLPTRFLPPRHYKGLAKNLLTTNLIKVLQRY